MMKSKHNMLVVARKYNDIYYAISTEEWEKCEQHYLLMITDRLDNAKYPMQEVFDDVYTVHSEKGTIGYYMQCREINRLIRKINADIVVLSNLAMVANLITLNSKKVNNVILVEDGLMNYYDFKPSQRMFKKVLEFLFGINNQKLLTKISKTYVLKPDLAKYYYGRLLQLKPNLELFTKFANVEMSLKGKSIFVGQDLYNVTNITVEEYCSIVNKVIKEHQIDYYLPHTRCSKEECIECQYFDLSNSLVTLEVYASLFPFKVFSFSSSVLYSTKLINPMVETYSIRSPKTDLINNDSIIYKYVNKIISI